MFALLPQRIDYLDNTQKAYCNMTYLKWLTSHGFTPIIITDLNHLDAIVSLCDILIIGGGYDIHPSFYQMEEESNYPHYNKEVDLLDFALCKAFMEKDKPILGICRGLQVLNVYFQGSLFSHIENHMNSVHPLYFRKDSLLNKIYEKIYLP